MTFYKGEEGLEGKGPIAKNIDVQMQKNNKRFVCKRG